jgi:hypothetical protein
MLRVKKQAPNSAWDSLPFRDEDVCADLKEKNTANIQEGIDSPTRALRLARTTTTPWPT